MNADTLVRAVYPPTTGEAILGLLARRVGETVTLEEMAVAAHGDTPQVWQYGATEAWYNTARSHVGMLRKRLASAGLELDIETVFGAGYRLVERKPRRRMTPAEIAQWREKCLAEYDRLMSASPGLTLTAACQLITKKYRRKLYWTTMATWLAKRREPTKEVSVP